MRCEYPNCKSNEKAAVLMLVPSSTSTDPKYLHVCAPCAVKIYKEERKKTPK